MEGTISIEPSAGEIRVILCSCLSSSLFLKEEKKSHFLRMRDWLVKKKKKENLS